MMAVGVKHQFRTRHGSTTYSVLIDRHTRLTEGSTLLLSVLGHTGSVDDPLSHRGSCTQRYQLTLELKTVVLTCEAALTDMAALGVQGP